MQPSYRFTWVLPDGTERVVDGYRQFNVLAHAELEELLIPQKCGGQAECGTCRVRVLSGEMTQLRGEEAELIERHAKRFTDSERLACQCRPRSDVRIEILAVCPPDLRDVEAQ